jgi:iron complex outermembrane receptor protein
METRTRAFVIVVAAALALVRSAFGEPQAAAAVTIEYRIPPQPLAQALNAWAQQSGLQLIWPAREEAAQTASRALYGKYQPMQALTMLLEDSGLRFSVLKEGTVALSERADDAATSGTGSRR